jgi:hypothetical protein
VRILSIRHFSDKFRQHDIFPTGYFASLSFFLLVILLTCRFVIFSSFLPSGSFVLIAPQLGDDEDDQGTKL